MKELNILYGFSDSAVQRRIEKSLQDRGYSVNGNCVCGKVSIISYIKQHPEIDACVLIETMQDGSSFLAEDLTKLTDERDINVVIVLGGDRKGSEYVRQLYAGGILGGVFQDSGRREGGVSVPDIVDLLLEPRNRKIARIYYGIAMDSVVDSDKVSDEKFKEFTRFLSNEGNYDGIGERYLRVVTSLTRNQNVDLFRRLPASVKNAILSTPEYVRAKVAIESTPAKVIVTMSTGVATKKGKKAKKELKKLEDVSEEVKNVPAVNSIDQEEYVENLLRPFMNTKKCIPVSMRRIVSEEKLHKLRYQMAAITGETYAIPMKTNSVIEKNEPSVALEENKENDSSISEPEKKMSVKKISSVSHEKVESSEISEVLNSTAEPDMAHENVSTVENSIELKNTAEVKKIAPAVKKIVVPSSVAQGTVVENEQKQEAPKVKKLKLNK